MPKKSRRTKAKHRARLAEEIQRRHPQQAKPTIAEPQFPTKVSPISAKASPGIQGSVDRYQYVIAEMKRIGILAGVIILTLVVLSFVLG